MSVGSYARSWCSCPTKYPLFSDSSLNAIQITVSAPERSRQVEELMARLVQKEHSYIDVPSDGGRTVRLRTDSIIRIYSQNRKNYISTADGIIRTSAPIN